MKLLFYVPILAVLIWAESPRLAVPLKEFFTGHTEILSIVILSVSVCISIIGGRLINGLTGFLIFLIIISGWYTNLKDRYDSIIRDSEIFSEAEKLPIVKLKEKSGCWHDRKNPDFYNNCMSTYIQERNQTIKLNEMATKHNAKVKPSPDLFEFWKLCGIAVTISIFFSLALWFFSSKCAEELPAVSEWIRKKREKKEIDKADQRKADSLTERLRALDTIEAVNLVIEKGLAKNDWTAINFLSKIRELNIDAEYRKVRRQKQSVKKLSKAKTYSGLKVVNGGKE